MSTSRTSVLAGELQRLGRPLACGPRTRAYFASDAARMGQTVLGLIWLLDDGLRFQSFMYGKDSSRY